VHATEGVWGLACDPFDHVAVEALLLLKGRPVSKGLIEIGADADDFLPDLNDLEATERQRVLDSWPGAVTWILPNRRFPVWITGGRDQVAVRVPGTVVGWVVAVAVDWASGGSGAVVRPARMPPPMATATSTAAAEETRAVRRR